MPLIGIWTRVCVQGSNFPFLNVEFPYPKPSMLPISNSPFPMDSSPPRGIVVFSGGTAANSLVDVFNDIAHKRQCPLNYVIPISDNGGSSSELIRVFGGPGIGDIRSMTILPSPILYKYLSTTTPPPTPTRTFSSPFLHTSS